jgi:hypothetical protein
MIPSPSQVISNHGRSLVASSSCWTMCWGTLALISRVPRVAETGGRSPWRAGRARRSGGCAPARRRAGRGSAGQSSVCRRRGWPGGPGTATGSRLGTGPGRAAAGRDRLGEGVAEREERHPATDLVVDPGQMRRLGVVADHAVERQVAGVFESQPAGHEQLQQHAAVVGGEPGEVGGVFQLAHQPLGDPAGCGGWCGGSS